jgi:hypothetical protein
VGNVGLSGEGCLGADGKGHQLEDPKRQGLC